MDMESPYRFALCAAYLKQNIPRLVDMIIIVAPLSHTPYTCAIHMDTTRLLYRKNPDAATVRQVRLWWSSYRRLTVLGRRPQGSGSPWACHHATLPSDGCVYNSCPGMSWGLRQEFCQPCLLHCHQSGWPFINIYGSFRTRL